MLAFRRPKLGRLYVGLVGMVFTGPFLFHGGYIHDFLTFRKLRVGHASARGSEFFFFFFND
jgi:hypothetical protein